MRVHNVLTMQVKAAIILFKYPPSLAYYGADITYGSLLVIVRVRDSIQRDTVL